MHSSLKLTERNEFSEILFKINIHVYVPLLMMLLKTSLIDTGSKVNLFRTGVLVEVPTIHRPV